MSNRIFISYAHEDKPAADAVCARLEQSGIRCWIAPRDILPGREWGDSIIEAIELARVMVLIFSGQSNTSKQVLREVTAAVKHNVIVIPFRVEDIKPCRSMEYLLSVPHWLDALTPPLEKHIDELKSTIMQIVGSDVEDKASVEMPGGAQVETGEECRSSLSSPHRRFPWYLFVAAFAVLLFVQKARDIGCARSQTNSHGDGQGQAGATGSDRVVIEGQTIFNRHVLLGCDTVAQHGQPPGRILGKVGELRYDDNGNGDPRDDANRILGDLTGWQGACQLMLNDLWHAQGVADNKMSASRDLSLRNGNGVLTIRLNYMSIAAVMEYMIKPGSPYVYLTIVVDDPKQELHAVQFGLLQISSIWVSSDPLEMALIDSVRRYNQEILQITKMPIGPNEYWGDGPPNWIGFAVSERNWLNAIVFLSSSHGGKMGAFVMTGGGNYNGWAFGRDLKISLMADKSVNQTGSGDVRAELVLVPSTINSTQELNELVQAAIAKQKRAQQDRDLRQITVHVSRSSGIRLPDEGNNSFSWKDLRLAVDDEYLTYSISVKVWKRSASPITQMFLAVGNESAKCFYNGIPGTAAEEEYRVYSGKVPMPALKSGDQVKVYIVKTLDYTVASALSGIHEGLGLREEIGIIVR